MPLVEYHSDDFTRFLFDGLIGDSIKRCHIPDEVQQIFSSTKPVRPRVVQFPIMQFFAGWFLDSYPELYQELFLSQALFLVELVLD